MLMGCNFGAGRARRRRRWMPAGGGVEMRLPKFYEMVLWEDPASDFDGWQDIGKLASTEPDLEKNKKK